jgi:ankyrin repeat protein
VRGWIERRRGEGRERIDEIFIYILKFSQQINEQNKLGNTPLHVASRHHRPDAVRVLLRHGANANVRNWKGDTPLLLAVSVSNYAVVHELLRNRRTDMHKENVHGMAPLCLAAQGGNVWVVEELLKYANPNRVCSAGCTPLHVAASVWVMAKLIDHGASTESLDNFNRTPLYTAACRGDVEAVCELLRHGACGTWNRWVLPITSSVYCWTCGGGEEVDLCWIRRELARR